MRKVKAVSHIFEQRNSKKYDLYFYSLVLMFVFFICLITFSLAFADTSYDYSQISRNIQEMSNALKKTTEDRLSEIKKQTDTTKTESRAERVKRSEVARKESNVVSINLITLLKQALLTLENNNLTHCKVLSKPLLPDSLKLTAVEDNAINNIKAQYLNNLATSYSNIDLVLKENEKKKLVDYIQCLSLYSEIITQATNYLLTDFQFLQNHKVIKKDRNNYHLYAKDLLFLLDAAILKAYDTIYYKKTNETQFADIYKKLHFFLSEVVNNNLYTCKFVKSIDTINCNALTITLTPSPLLTFANMNIYSDKDILSLDAKLSLDLSNSIIDSFNNALMSIKIKEFQKSVDEVKSKNTSVEMLTAMKKSLDKIQTNKITVSDRKK